MILHIKRIYTNDRYTISHVYVDDAYVCDAIEDTDRMLDSSMTESEIAKKKVYAKTAIPTGKYEILMDVISPKYSKKQYYMDVCKGRVPRFNYVKGFSGVLLHCGNTAEDSAGCLLVGYNKVKGKVLNSKIAFESLYYKMKAAYDIGQKITCTITRTYKKNNFI